MNYGARKTNRQIVEDFCGESPQTAFLRGSRSQFGAALFPDGEGVRAVRWRSVDSTCVTARQFSRHPWRCLLLSPQLEWFLAPRHVDLWNSPKRFADFDQRSPGIAWLQSVTDQATAAS